MQTIAEKLIEQGKQEGVMKEKKEVVSKGLEANLPIEIISMLSGFSLDEIRQYKALMKMKPATMN